MYKAYENRPEILDSSKKGFVGTFYLQNFNSYNIHIL